MGDPPATAAARGRAVLGRTLLVGATLLAALTAAPLAAAATFTVTTTADTGPGSLRQAILDSNGTLGIDTIDFNIPGAGPHVIQPVTALPQVTDHVTIDGSAEVDGAGLPLVSVDGGPAAPPSLYGLELQVAPFTGSSTIRALAFTRWDLGNGAGVRLGGVGLMSVYGSLFGLDSTGLALGNYAGISGEGGNGHQIGGPNAGERNVISANVTGLALSGSGSTNVVGNWIGVGLDGSTPLPNSIQGILVQSTGVNTSIGFASAGSGNRIVGNAGAGVRVVPGGQTKIIGNQIELNGGLGIDLGFDNVTPNDPGDGDTGPNDLQNYPSGLTATLQGGGQIRITGTLDSVLDTTYVLHFYSSEAADPSGNGEGANFLGSVSSGVGAFSYTFTPIVPVAPGDFVTATATAFTGYTSEFSAAVAATSPPGTTYVVNSAADPGDGVCNLAHCSLREAMDAANAGAGTDTIAFTIGTGPVTISPVFPLPTVIDPVVLDATTQPGYVGRPLVRLDGAGAGASTIGLEIRAGGSTVRGLSITNFTLDGIRLRDGSTNIVEDNYVGVFNGAGVEAAGNGSYGVLALSTPDNVIRRNVIGGNGFGVGNFQAGVGLFDDSGGAVVEDDLIGIGPGGEMLPNEFGVTVTRSSGVRLESNTIARNTGKGVLVFGTPAVRNRITENSIHENGDVGIDLAGGGVTANDAGDVDSGENGLQNFPELSSAVKTGVDLDVAGTLDTVTGQTVRIEIFAAPGCDPSGHGEGTFIGFGNVVVSSAPQAFTLDNLPAAAVNVGDAVSATATDAAGNTSEFSACVDVEDAGGATFTVNSAAEPGDGTCDATCTLRDAVDDANATPTDDVIEFAIGTGPQTIALANRLLVTDTVDIDGTSQPGFAGAPLIELDGAGVSAGPTDGGIELFAGAPGSRIRGLVLNGFQTNAIGVYGLGNRITGNYIGTSAAGTAADGNREAGIYLQDASSTTIGGPDAPERNVIAGNDGDGIRIVGADGTSNDVEGNYIGVSAEGDTPLGNLGDGVHINASLNTITQNSIVGNGGSGIAVAGGSRNTITENQIRDSLRLGIDLADDGLTPNDFAPPADSDVGPNGLQNFPDIQSAVSDGTDTTISGTMSSEPSELYTIELFSTPNCDGSSHGEGATFLGSTTMTTNPTGGGPWSVVAPVAVPGGHFVTATATDSLGNTSEFSRCLAVQAPNTLVVNQADDAGSGGCTEVDCTLREALEDAGSLPGRQRIVFAILPPGPKTLALNSRLLVTSPVEIDATTQIGNVGMGIILNGSGLPLDPNDGILELGPGSDGSLVRGLVVNGSESYGIVVASAGNAIESSFIGTDDAGTLAVPNLNGMLVSGNNNAIGGEVGPAGVVGNLISGNAEAGLQITGSNNEVKGNWIGLDRFGFSALPNILLGVEILNGDDNRIGVGNLSGNGRNIISGSLELISLNNTIGSFVAGNWLGTDATGTDTSLALAPAEAGISINGGANNQIGESDAGNVIAGADGLGESGVGIRVNNSSFTNIVENRIGTDQSGAFDLGNYGAGIHLSGGSNSSLIFRNVIGFTRPLDPPFNGSGVVVESGVENRITENVFRSNAGLAIDLGGDGPTPNDGGAADDADTGPNDLLNHPVVSQASLVGNTLTVSGSIDSNPNQDFTIEVFVREAGDDDQDARRFLGAQSLPTPASGQTPFSVDFILGPGDVDLGDVVVATATDADNNTSELSAGVVVAAPTTGVTAEVTIAPQAGSTTVTAPARVELEDVPAETFIAAAKSALETAPLGSIPLGSIPLGSIPLGSIPLGSIGFLEPQIRALLGGIPLSTVPLTPPQSWSALLQSTTLAGIPLQSVPLQQALDVLAAQPAGISAVPLGSIGLRGSELGSLTPEAVGLGVAPLGSIGIGDEGVDEPGDTNLADWCEWLSGPPVNCTNPASLQGESVLSTSLRGAPLGSIPLGSIPLGSIPLGSIPLGSIPLGSIDVQFSPLGSIPLGSIPLGSIPLGSIPLGSIPLGSINLQQSPLGSIPLGSIPLGSIPILFTCQPSCPTGGVIRDHTGQLRPNLTLEQFMRAVGQAALGNVTFADVLLWVEPATLNGYTVRQFVETVLLIPDNELTFADLLAGFLAESSLGWERLNLNAANVNSIAADAGTAHYAVEVELTPDTPAGLGATDSTVATVTLPDGFAYLPGSSTLDDLSTPAPPTAAANPSITGSQLSWTLPLTVGPRHQLRFDARPRSTLGPAQATVEADPAGGPLAAGPAPATLMVTDTFEANNDPAGPLTALQTSSFYLSYVTGADDVDFFSYPVPPVAGTRVTFNLSHLQFDGDVVVYGPSGQVLRDPRPGTEPLDGQPLDDDGPRLTSDADALEQQTLSDLALANLPVLGVATLRSTEDDAVTVVSDGQPGNYVIQVTGFNGASSAEPYMLRPVQRAPVALPSCQPRTFPNAGTNSTSLTRGTVPAVVDTVFVVNKAQWERVHGAAAVASALTTLDAQMAGLAADGHPSAILQVDADPDVQAAVATWNACPTELTRANAVMREIGLAIDAFRAAHLDAGSNSTVQNIVLLGGDEVIPSARLEDRTTVANEDGYAETFAAGSELSTTLRQGYFLSDDPYGDVDPIPFFDRQLHIPDVPVGRLPTTPAAAARAVVRFTAFDGRLAPVTAATSGYDFLTDGAQQVDAALRSIPGVAGVNPPGLIGNTWTKATLLAGLLPGGVPRDLTSINGHADHRGVEPAAGTALFQIGDLPPVTGGATEAYDRRLVFSMGCHAGLSVSDVFVVSPLGTADWPQAYTQRGGTYAGSSGYAYGDGKLVAYSEDLHRRFAENLGGLAAPGDLTIGQAIVLAKQDYFGELGLVGVYDEKASSEFALYGLPMWQIGGAAAAAAPASAPAAAATVEPAAAAAPVFGIQSAPTGQELVVEPATGLTAEQLTTDWTPPAPTPVPGAGSYVVGLDGVQVTHFRPVEPKTVLPVTVPSAHGALITELSSTSTTPFDPYFARPIVDSTAGEPLLDWDRIVHPAKLQTVTTSKLGTTKRHRLVLATGQFTGPPGGGETGTQRLFPHFKALVFSAASSDYAKPILGRITATGVGASVAFSVETRDQAPNGPNDVVRVRVGYLDQPDGGTTRAWRFVDLIRTPSTDRWSGAGPLVSATADFLYFVQSVDRGGNVAVSTNKGIYFEEEAAPPSTNDGLSIDAPAPPASGWYGGSVPVTVRLGGQPADADDHLEVDVDGGGFQPYSGPVTVTGDGSHTVTARAPDKRTVALTVLIDTGAPQIVIASPVAGAQVVQGSALTADYACLDAGAGVEPAACTGTVANGAAINTSTVGPKTFTVNATDRLGKTATRTVSYTVVRRSILFASTRTGSGDIYTVGEGGGAVVRLTDHNAVDAEPARSSDGSKIAFTSTRNGNVEIYSMNADGSNVQRLTNNSATDSSPAWSPDGTKIVFSSNRTENQFDIWVMNADGTGLQRLTTNKKDDLDPAWSPNGQRIAFSSDRTGAGDIYAMNANGGSETRLTPNRRDRGRAGLVARRHEDRVRDRRPRELELRGLRHECKRQRPDEADQRLRPRRLAQLVGGRGEDRLLVRAGTGTSSSTS